MIPFDNYVIMLQLNNISGGFKREWCYALQVEGIHGVTLEASKDTGIEHDDDKKI